MTDFVTVGDIVTILAAVIGGSFAWAKVQSRLDRVDDRFEHERELSELAVKQLRTDSEKVEGRLDKHLSDIYKELKSIREQLADRPKE